MRNQQQLALPVAMPKPVIQKVHTNIGHVRSLCGLVPKNGHYSIVPFNEFFSHPEEIQCAVCLKRVEGRGYNPNRLRAEAMALRNKNQPATH